MIEPCTIFFFLFCPISCVHFWGKCDCLQILESFPPCKYCPYQLKSSPNLQTTYTDREDTASCGSIDRDGSDIEVSVCQRWWVLWIQILWCIVITIVNSQNHCSILVSVVHCKIELVSIISESCEIYIYKYIINIKKYLYIVEMLH